MTPSNFLKKSRGQLVALDTKAADEFMAILNRDAEWELQTFIDIPRAIPAKYHARMALVWRAMIARVLFERVSEKISYAERFKLSQRIK